MWILLLWDQLFSPSCIQEGHLVQQGESERYCRIHPASDLYWNLSLSGIGRSLPVIHQDMCLCGTATTWTPIQRWCRQEEWVSHAHQWSAGCFETHKKACLEASVLSFADFNKPFLLETDARKLGSGVVLSQKQPDGWYHPVAYMSQSLTIHGHNYHILPNKVSWPWSGQLLSSSRNTCAGNCLL